LGTIVDAVANEIAVVDAVACCDDVGGLVIRAVMGRREDERCRGEDGKNEKLHVEWKTVVLEGRCS
jgi:hypothetical protein